MAKTDRKRSSGLRDQLVGSGSAKGIAIEAVQKKQSGTTKKEAGEKLPSEVKAAVERDVASKLAQRAAQAEAKLQTTTDRRARAAYQQELRDALYPIAGGDRKLSTIDKQEIQRQKALWDKGQQLKRSGRATEGQSLQEWAHREAEMIRARRGYSGGESGADEILPRLEKGEALFMTDQAKEQLRAQKRYYEIGGALGLPEMQQIAQETADAIRFNGASWDRDRIRDYKAIRPAREEVDAHGRPIHQYNLTRGEGEAAQAWAPYLGNQMKGAWLSLLETARTATRNMTANRYDHDYQLQKAIAEQSARRAANERDQEERERLEGLAAQDAALADALRHKDAVRPWSDGQLALQRASRYHQTIMDAIPSKLGQHVADAAASGIQMAPALLASFVVPGAGLALIGAQAAGGKAGELGARGVPAQEALARGAVSGVIEGATEMLQIRSLLRMVRSAGGAPFLANVARQAGIEATEESASYVLNYAADVAARDPAATFSLQDLAENAAVGAISGAGFGGIGHMAGMTLGAGAPASVPYTPAAPTAPAASPTAPTTQRTAQEAAGAAVEASVRQEGTTPAREETPAQANVAGDTAGNRAVETLARPQGGVSTSTRGTTPAATEARQRAAQEAVRPTAQVEQQRPAAQQAYDLRRVRDAAASLGENGAKALSASYDGRVRSDEYYAGFSAYYAAGINGADLGTVRSDYGDRLTQAQRYAAWSAGQNDAALSLERERRAARYAPVAGTDSGLVYDDFVREAVESGRTRTDVNGEDRVYLTAETADKINRVAKALGVRVQFVDAVRGGTANAQISGSTVLVERDGPDPVMFLVGHEMTHRMQELAPAEYRSFRDIAAQEEQDRIQRRIDIYAAQGVELTYEQAMDEVAADYAGRLIDDGRALDDFLSKHRDDRTLLQKLRDAIRAMIGKLTGAEKRKAQTAEGKLTAALEAASRQATRLTTNENAAQTGGGTRFSINERFARDVREWSEDGQPTGEHFVLGSTGPVLQGLGAIESDIYMNGDKIKKILHDHPEMTIREIQRIPEMLEDPVLILKSRNAGRGARGNTRMVVFGTIKAKDGRPVLCVLDLRPRERGFVLDDMQRVTSAYTKDTDPVAFVQSSDVMFLDEKRATRLLSDIGFQMPISCDRSGYIGTISYARDDVKLSGVPFPSVVDMTGGESATRYSFGGVRANGADLQGLRKAQEMQEAGADRESIRKATGWHEGRDGKWRFELDDSRMTLRDIERMPNYIALGKLVDAPELFAAYPDMADIDVTFQTLDDGVRGAYDRRSDVIQLSRGLMKDPEALLTSLIHEAQHAIQAREGFARGASVNYWNRRLEAGFDGRTAKAKREGAQLRERYEALRARDPQFVADMDELNAMTPTVPRGKVDFDTLEQIEPDPVEWVRFDERRDQLEAQYGEERVWDYFDLRASIDRNAKDSSRMPGELYRATAGEIEDRDTAKRRKLTAAERREKGPDLGDEDTVFAESGGDGYAMSQNERDSVKEQLRKHQDVLNDMKTVATIRSNGWKGMSTGAFRQKIVSDLKRTGYRVDHPNIGVIEFDEKLLNRSLNYIQTDAEAAAYQAIPQVLKRGIEISGHDDHKKRGYETLTIAAPVELNGKRGNMAVVVMRTKGNRYKVHRILTPEGEAFVLPEMANAEPTTVGALTNGSRPLGGSAPAIDPASRASVSERTGDVKEDGRYSLKAGTESKSAAALQEENRLLREQMKDYIDLQSRNRKLRESRDYWQGQVRRTQRVTTDRKAVAAAAKKLIRDYGADIAVEDIQGDLQSLYDYIASGYDGKDELTHAEARRRAEAIARTLVENAVAVDSDLYDQYSDLRDYLRTTKIVFGKEYQGDIPDYGDFRKRQFGRLKLSGEGGTNIDQVYQELSTRWPEFFDEEVQTQPSDQLLRITEVLDEVYSTTEYDPFSRYMDQAVTGAANEILEAFFDLPQTRKTFADRQAARLEETRARDRQRLQQVRAQSADRLAELRAQNRQRVQSAIAKERETRERKLDALKDRYAAKDAAGRERRTARALRGKIVRHVKVLSRKLLRPSDEQHVPEGLRGAVAAMLESIDLESQYTIDENGRRVKGGDGAPTKRTEAFRALRLAYAQIIKDSAEDGGGYSLVIDPDLMDDLDELEAMKDTKLADMSVAQLETVWATVKAVEASIRTANKMLAASRFQTVSSFAEGVRADNLTKKDRGSYRGVLGKVDKLANLDMLTPQGYFHRLGKTGEELFRMMRAAQDRHISIMQQAQEKTAQILGKTDTAALERETHTFDLQAGTVKMSTAQIMSLYELMKREQARGHVLVGGIRPDALTGRRSLKEERRSDPVHVTAEEIANITSVLTEEQTKIADGLQRYMGGDLAALGNEASMTVYGYEKFKAKDYFPIPVDRNQTKRDVGKEAQAVTIPGRGFTKGTKPNANNAVMVESIFDAYAAHVNDMATYAAWLPTVEDMRRIRDFTFRDEEGARTGGVKAIIERVFGRNGNAYLDKLMDDINQGVRTKGTGTLTDGLVSNYKAAAVAANLRVILQQPTSILRALDTLDAKYLLEGTVKRGDWEKVKRYAPIAVWKDWGYFEINTGRQMKDVLLSSDTVLERARQAGMAGADRSRSATSSARSTRNGRRC